MEERNQVILRTYKNVWKFEREIYSIEGVKLLFPIKPNELLYFIFGEIIAILVFKALPFTGGIPWPVRYLFIPFGIMKFLTKQKLDGKLPHKFFMDWVVYVLSPKRFEHFRAISEPKKALRFVTPISYRLTVIINNTEEALRVLSKKKLQKKKDKSQVKKRKQNGKGE